MQPEYPIWTPYDNKPAWNMGYDFGEYIALGLWQFVSDTHNNVFHGCVCVSGSHQGTSLVCGKWIPFAEAALKLWPDARDHMCNRYYSDDEKVDLVFEDCNWPDEESDWAGAHEEYVRKAWMHKVIEFSGYLWD